MYKFLLFSFLISTSILFAQDNAINKLSIDGGIGFNNSILPFTPGYSNSYLNPFNLNVGARKMFNNKFITNLQNECRTAEDYARLKNK